MGQAYRYDRRIPSRSSPRPAFLAVLFAAVIALAAGSLSVARAADAHPASTASASPPAADGPSQTTATSTTTVTINGRTEVSHGSTYQRDYVSPDGTSQIHVSVRNNVSGNGPTNGQPGGQEQPMEQ